MLTPLARSYVATLKRHPSESRVPVIEEALRRAGFPVMEPVVRFHVDYGGLEQWDGLNRLVWGIVHDDPDPDSVFPGPGEADGFTEEGEHYVSCCNCHLSDHWMITSTGEILWCFEPPIARSFEVTLERDALLWELMSRGRIHRVRFADPDEAGALLLPRVADALVPAASDAYQARYLKDGLYVTGYPGGRVEAWKLGEGVPPLLEGIPLRG